MLGKLQRNIRTGRDGIRRLEIRGDVTRHHSPCTNQKSALDKRPQSVIWRSTDPSCSSGIGQATGIRRSNPPSTVAPVPRVRRLKVGTWNVTTLNKKHLEVDRAMIELKLDLLGLSSIKTHGSGERNLMNGKLFYSGCCAKMKCTRAKAGVGCIIAEHLVDSVLEWRPVNGRLALLRLRLPEEVVNFVLVYAPHMGTRAAEYDSFLLGLNDLLESLSSGEQAIILGDFNARVGANARGKNRVIGPYGELTRNAPGKKLLDFCCVNGLSIMNGFTRNKDLKRFTWEKHSMGQRSIIDYLITQQEHSSKVVSVTVKRGAEGTTDHFLLVGLVNVKQGISKTEQNRGTTFRLDHKQLASPAVQLKFNEILKSELSKFSHANLDSISCWKAFRGAVNSAAQASCGLKKTFNQNGGRKRNTWFSDTVRAALSAKKKAYRQWLCDRTQHSKQAYREERLKVARCVKEAKSKAWEDFGTKLNNDFRNAIPTFWQKVKCLRKSERNTGSKVKGKNHDLISDPKSVLNRWREYFSDLLNPVEAETEAPVWDKKGKRQGRITFSEVKEAVESLKNGKAAGHDEISPELLKCMGKLGLRWLQRVCLKAWESGVAPEDWKVSTIVPIYKGKGDILECCNYRGISLLSLPGKVYAKILERRCRAIVETKLSESQCGFRPGRSTTDQLFTLESIVSKRLAHNQATYMCFVDLEKAYDRVPRNRLFGVLQAYGIDDKLLRAIASLYADCKCCVRINGQLSELFDVNCGLKQGCVLSPLLFIVYMDNIIKKTVLSDEHSEHGIVFKHWRRCITNLLFADDIVLTAESEQGLQVMVSSLNKACLEAGMKINVSKSEVLVAARNPVKCAILCGTKFLEQVDEFKYLGVLFTSTGKIETEIETRVRKAGQMLGVVRGLAKAKISQEAKLAIYKTVFRPILTYGCERWSRRKATDSLVNAVDMNFLRHVSGNRRNDHVSNTTVRDTLSIEPILTRIERTQLRYFGHVIRMPEYRMPKRVYGAQALQRRARGRPPNCMYTNWESLCKRVARSRTDCERLALDRGAWREKGAAHRANRFGD